MDPNLAALSTSAAARSIYESPRCVNERRHIRVVTQDDPVEEPPSSRYLAHLACSAEAEELPRRLIDRHVKRHARRAEDRG